MMRPVGLHLRITETLQAVAQRAQELQMPVFQCFLLHQDSHHFLSLARSEIAAFQQVRDRFDQLFVHASYWTNLSSIQDASMRPINKEMHLAKQLGFSHIVVHSGSAKGAQDKMEGIDAMVRRLNRLLKHENDLQIVLENTAHGNMSIGSDIADFNIILNKLDQPEKISFCIDTVHAHVYGYSVQTAQEQSAFFAQLDEMIGLERIALIHLNNTTEQLGSCMDRHALIDDGIFSLEALKRFALHPAIAHVPVIMELPVVSDEKQVEQIDLVRSWHQKDI